jgi:hypothetical protein
MTNSQIADREKVGRREKEGMEVGVHFGLVPLSIIER